MLDSFTDSMPWLGSFRHKIINLLLGIIVAISTIGIVYISVVYSPLSKGFSFILIVYYASYLLLLLLNILRKIPDSWRALGFLILLYFFAFSATLNGWLGGGGRTFLLSWIVLTSILISPKTGTIAAGISLLTYLGFGLAFNQGWLIYEKAPAFANLAIVIVEGIGFTMAVGMISTSLWFYNEALAAANQANEEARHAQTMLTERAQQLNAANQLLTKQARSLELANDALESFTYSVSHDLRAPLRVIDSYVRILQEDYQDQLDENGINIIDRLLVNTTHMSNLIEDLLTFSRIDRHPLEKQSLNPTEIVQKVIEEMRSDIEGREIEFEIADLPPCKADPRLIHQVFANLIDNAIKYTRPRANARIEINWQEKHGRTIYYVRDNGVGFDMTYVDKLFAVFQRLHHADEFEGTGIGLAIVQGILNRHGGNIWCEAAIDQGATFYFTLGPKSTQA